MRYTLISLENPAPPGFSTGNWRKRDLLDGVVGLYASSREQAEAILPGMAWKMQGILAIPALSTTEPQRIGPLCWLWEVASEQMRGLHMALLPALEATSAASMECELNRQEALKTARLREELSNTRSDYLRVTSHLSAQVEQLGAAHAAVSLHRDELEVRVAERTSQLSAANRELHQVVAQLVQSEKLAALGSLVAGIAHEVNTPLGNALTTSTALSETVAALLKAVRADQLRRSQLEGFLDSIGEYADLLERNTSRAAELVEHFKQLAVDQTSMRRRSFALDDLVRSLLKALEPSYRTPAHRIESHIPPGLQFDSFPGALEQILTNLVDNAVKHGLPATGGGYIRIEAVPLAGDRARLRLIDNGRGMNATEAARAFEPFFTTRMGKGGSGLGLYIVHGLVNGVLGGTVELHSSPGNGTTIDINLPRHAPRQNSGDPRVAPPLVTQIAALSDPLT